MSKHEYFKSIHKELKKINKVIDEKIILGKSYKEESMRHKFLLTQIRKLQNSQMLYKFMTFLF